MTQELEIKIVEEYESGLSSIKIAEKHNYKRPKTILDVLKKHNVKRRGTARKTDYDYSFFKSIKTEAEAYSMGLFMTDGYVLSSGNGIGIQLQKRDEKVLHDINEKVGGCAAFLDIKKKGRRQAMTRMTIHCQSIVKNACKYGLVKNKTKTLNIEKNPPVRLLKHFCRGVFDGDGTIGVAKNGNIWCQFVTASKKFAYSFPELNTPSELVVYKPSKGRSTYTVRVCGGNSSTINFLQWMYEDAEIFIPRKMKKVQDILRAKDENMQSRVGKEKRN